MQKYLLVFLIVFRACTTKEEKDLTEVCLVKDRPQLLIESYFVDTTKPKSSDTRVVNLKLGKYTSTQFPEANTVADSALHIASVLLSSNDFKSIMEALDFTCKNYKYYCKENCKNCTDRFGGKVVLDSAFRKQEVKLDLFLRNCDNEFGHSTRNKLEVYSCQPVVFYDEKKLTPAYCYAYHIAHEYMHIVGFFHTDHVDDVAEKVGLIGWKILLKWRRAGLNIMQIQPGQL